MRPRPIRTSSSRARAMSPTLETIAAAWLIHQFAPDLKVRVVNVVDLTVLFPKKAHPHGLEPS